MEKRLIEFKKIPVILSVVFWVILYLLLLKYFDNQPEISSNNLKEFYTKYWMYASIVFPLLGLILFYILAFLKFILRLKNWFFSLILYIIVYWFFLFLWLDLMFFESRLADFALVIINTYSITLVVSSSIILLIAIWLSFKKIEIKDNL